MFDSADTVSQPNAGSPISASNLLILSMWCGLLAGLLEVGSTFVKAHCWGADGFFKMSRHFLWLIPITDLTYFLVLGLFLTFVTMVSPRRGGWLSLHSVCALTMLPVLLILGSRISGFAWLLISLGISSHVVPRLVRNPGRFRRFAWISFPVVAALVTAIPLISLGSRSLKLRRELGRPVPQGVPNVLLIVLDTVRADRLSLYGYGRSTSPNLERLARRGVRFDAALATASWTLPSHASMFTGRWFHELSAGWMTPLDSTFPTLAEFLGSHGYATAGFAANTLYCAYDSGLDRGFTHYEDHVPPDFSFAMFGYADLTKRIAARLDGVRRFARSLLHRDLEWPFIDRLSPGRRKHGDLVNRQFLTWLSDREQPQRPFFAFLNYFDAHEAYVLPRGVKPRFKLDSENGTDLSFLHDTLDFHNLSEKQLAIASTAYDSCLAYLDDCLGSLVDELDRRGVLDNTLMIITADHGESFGVNGQFSHGGSLYRAETHVPLLILLPSRDRGSQVVSEPVSLRDLPATIVDELNMASDSPFPGRSLARYWNPSSLPGEPRESTPPLSEIGLPYPDPSSTKTRVARGPLAALKISKYTLIYNYGDRSEELYDRERDPQELHNLAAEQAMIPMVKKMEETLNQLTQGPLTPGRFKP